MFLLLAHLGCATPDGTGGPDQSLVDDENSLIDSDFIDDVGCEGDVGIEAGNCAPDFALVSADGSLVTLSKFQGQRVVVLGTATW